MRQNSWLLPTLDKLDYQTLADNVLSSIHVFHAIGTDYWGVFVYFLVGYWSFNIVYMYKLLLLLIFAYFSLEKIAQKLVCRAKSPEYGKIFSISQFGVEIIRISFGPKWRICKIWYTKNVVHDIIQYFWYAFELIMVYTCTLHLTVHSQYIIFLSFLINLFSYIYFILMENDINANIHSSCN